VRETSNFTTRERERERGRERERERESERELEETGLWRAERSRESL
jgi:hypothetical protein